MAETGQDMVTRLGPALAAAWGSNSSPCSVLWHSRSHSVSGKQAVSPSVPLSTLRSIGGQYGNQYATAALARSELANLSASVA